MAQLAGRVLQVKCLKAEKARTNKYRKKKKVAYVEIDKYLSNLGDEYVEGSTVNVIELKLWPPYICKFLKPSNGKNHVKPSKNDKFATKTYTFDINKCDEIFEFLVIDGQIIILLGLKTPPL